MLTTTVTDVQRHQIDAILDAVRERTGLDLIYRWSNDLGSRAVCHDARGREHFVVYNVHSHRGTDYALVRGVLRAKPRAKRRNWLTNGQASQGCTQVYWWREGELTVPLPAS